MPDHDETTPAFEARSQVPPAADPATHGIYAERTQEPDTVSTGEDSENAAISTLDTGGHDVEEKSLDPVVVSSQVCLLTE
jgi:hypothetical protein